MSDFPSAVFGKQGVDEIMAALGQLRHADHAAAAIKAHVPGLQGADLYPKDTIRAPLGKDVIVRAAGHMTAPKVGGHLDYVGNCAGHMEDGPDVTKWTWQAVHRPPGAAENAGLDLNADKKIIGSHINRIRMERGGREEVKLETRPDGAIIAEASAGSHETFLSARGQVHSEPPTAVALIIDGTGKHTGFYQQVAGGDVEKITDPAVTSKLHYTSLAKLEFGPDGKVTGASW